MADGTKEQSADFQSNWRRKFFIIWAGQGFSLFGSQIVQFALIWWLTLRTGSATVLATATIVGLAPQILLTPFAGAIVDRLRRRTVMIVADGLIALSTLSLVILFLIGAVEIWHVYVVMLARASLQAFHWPAWNAATTLMVSKEHLARVGGLNQSIAGLANILAPASGAVMMVLMPMYAVLSIDILTAALAVLPLLMIRIPEPGKVEGGQRKSVTGDMVDGFRFIRDWPGLLMLLVIVTVINLLTVPAFALTPILVVDHFHGGAIEFATLESIFGDGVVLGGLALGAWGGFKKSMLTVLAGLVAMGVGTTAVGFVPASGFLIAVAVLFFVGMTSPIVNGSLHAVVQKAVRPDMQGRVFALISSAATAATPLGLVAAGPIADSYGVQIWFIAGGLATLILGIMCLFLPSVMNIEENANGG